jgi:hypothetical protein
MDSGKLTERVGFWNVNRSSGSRRVGMLTSACRKASGASPRLSATFKGRRKNAECRNRISARVAQREQADL